MGKKIIFTGGGSGGHVIPALTLIRELRRSESFELFYIGGKHYIERDIITREGPSYKAISTGKLRRYLSLQNIFDLFKVFWGTIQTTFFLIPFSRKETLILFNGRFCRRAGGIISKIVKF